MHDKPPFEIKTDVLGRVLIGEVERIAGCSRWTLRRMISDGKFPAPFAGLRRGQKRCWRLSDIIDWVRSQSGF